MPIHSLHFFFFQAEDGIRDKLVTGVQTCALPISLAICWAVRCARGARSATRNIPTHARFATTSSAAIRSTLRHRSERGHSLTPDPSLFLSVGYENVAEAPHGLNVRGFGRIRLDEPSQTRDLHV